MEMRSACYDRNMASLSAPCAVAVTPMIIDYLMFADVIKAQGSVPSLITTEYDRIGASTFPFAYTLSVIFRLCEHWVDAGTSRIVHIEVTDSDGYLLREPFEFELEIRCDARTPEGTDVSGQFFLKVPELVFNRPGTYMVAIRVGEDVLLSKALYVLPKGLRA
jgi:hypothetical protein